jgi:FAD/FMN-containing dehydrogenase
MPFSCPTSEAISLGGALGANTHGRTTDTYGGFFADHVTGFRLSCPNGAVYDCSERASGQLERRLFRHVPGAFGALGLVTEMELELCPISPRTSVVMQVLSEHTGDPLAAVESYERHVENNRVGDTFRFSEGVGLVCFGEPRTGKAVVVARNRSPHDVAGTTLPLFDGRGTRNALLQLLVHRFPAPVQWLTPRLLRSGRRYTSSYYNWAFFQSSHDHAGEVFARASPAVRTLGRWLGVDPRLTLVHVGWVVPRAALVPFMRRYFELLDSPAHQAIAPHLELQDVLPLPTCRWPLNPSYRHERGSHVLTWSCRVLHRRADLLNQAIGFCRELSSSVRDLGAVVQLIKQIHVDDDVLRDMHQGAIDALAEIKREVDPQGLLRSRTLDRLGVTPI